MAWRDALRDRRGLLAEIKSLRQWGERQSAEIGRLEDIAESNSALASRAFQAEEGLRVMTAVLTDDGLDTYSLDVAREIESLLWQQHNGFSQRLARIQIIVREAVRKALTGECSWNYGTDLQRGELPKGSRP